MRRRQEVMYASYCAVYGRRCKDHRNTGILGKCRGRMWGKSLSAWGALLSMTILVMENAGVVALHVVDLEDGRK